MRNTYVNLMKNRTSPRRWSVFHSNLAMAEVEIGFGNNLLNRALKDEELYGEYRTKRLVLENYDNELD
jgi:hypothetical protein